MKLEQKNVVLYMSIYYKNHEGRLDVELQRMLAGANLGVEVYLNDVAAIERLRHQPDVDLFVTDDLLATIPKARENGINGNSKGGREYQGKVLLVTDLEVPKELESIVNQEKLFDWIVFLPEYTTAQVALIIRELAETGNSSTYEILSGRMPQLV